MRTIKTMGTGKIDVKPDIARIIATLRGDDRDYAALLDKAAADTDAVTEALQDAGLEKDSVITESFFVNAKYEGITDREGNYRQVFAGYEYTRTVKTEFKRDDATLGKALYALSQSEARPEFRVEYSLESSAEYAEKLLGLALGDAKARAEAIAKAAGGMLGKLQSAVHEPSGYGYGPMAADMSVNFAAKAERSAAGFNISMNPEDITLSETVAAIWEFEE